MKEKTLVSIRLDKDIVDLFDQLARENARWTRSALINEVLQFVIHAASKWDVLRMARTFPKTIADFTNLIHES